MKFLSKAFKLILIIFLLILLLGAATAFSWYMGWPLFTGAAVFFAVAALFIAVRGALGLWRWSDKKIFVSKMLKEHNAVATTVKEGNSAVVAAWRQGIACVQQSPMRFTNRLRNSQPWFIAIEDEASESSAFDAFGRRVPEGKSPLYWHFMESCVLLRLSTAESQGGVWETELEELLSARRSSAPLRGIVLSLRISRLAEMTDAEAASLGGRLRMRLQQIMMTANALYPVYILVEDIDDLPGMSGLISQYLPLSGEFAPGGWMDNPAVGALAAEAAADRLESLVLDGAAEGNIPRGETLSAILALRSLAPKLDVITESLSRILAHQVNPQIAGVYFCASHTSGRGGRKPAFVSDFILRVLPSAPAPRIFSGIPLSAGGKAALMGGWLLLTFAFCALLAANTVYQYRILSESSQITSESFSGDGLLVLDPSRGKISESYSRLYREMNQIIRMEAGHNSWYLPKMGGDMLGRSLTEAKRRYVADVNRIILRPMIDQFRANLSAGASEATKARDMDIAKELTWLTGVITDRLAHVSTKEAEETFPLTSRNEAEWTPVTGRLIVNALNWIENEEQIKALSMEIRPLLVQNFTRRGTNLLSDMVAQINDANQAEGVRLSQFWPHIPMNSISDLRIDYSFTAEGRLAVQQTIEDIEKIVGDSEVLSQYLERFRSEYFAQYALAWENFAIAFSSAGPSLRHGNLEYYANYSKILRVSDLPHIRAYRALAKEVAPLRESRQHPAWVDSMDVVDAVVSLALANSEEKNKDKISGIFSAAENAPHLLTQLRSGVRSNTKASDLVKAETEMRTFFENCANLLGIMSNPVSAHSFCSAGYGGLQRDDGAGTQPYNLAELSLDRAFEIIDSEWSPAMELLDGILDFIAAEATIVTAQSLQKRWEDEVLNSPAVLFGRGGGESYYGEMGIVPQFVQRNLASLLSLRGGIPVPAEWEGAPFPFDYEFLDALVQGSNAATQPLPPERKEETFRVNIATRPSLVNSDARLRPTMTMLTLEGDDGPQQIVNMNFPKDAIFAYNPDKSGKVAISVTFPDFELRREYNNFRDFVTDFSMGEQTFSSSDFSGRTDMMEEAEVRTVKIPIVVTNTAGIFDAHEVETPDYPDLPIRITRLVTRR